MSQVKQKLCCFLENLKKNNIHSRGKTVLRGLAGSRFDSDKNEKCIPLPPKCNSTCSLTI